MTITTVNTDAALKKYYLSAVTDQLNFYANPFLARIARSSANVLGKEIRKLVRNGMNGGVGAGTEDGALPTAHGNNYVALVQSLKNLYGTIEISDTAIRTSSTNAGSFVNLLDEEMNSLVRSASYNMSRMLFGDGSGFLGKVVSASGTTVTVDDVTNFTVGMQVDLYTNLGVLHEGNLYVKNVDRDKKTITVSKSTSPAADYEFYAAGSRNAEITGLKSIFGTAAIYGNPRTDNAFLKPYTKTVETLTEDEIQLAIDKVEENSGGKINFIMCSWGVRRALVKLLKENRAIVSTIDLEGGYKAVSFNGIPVVADRFCPKGTMFLLNTDDFVLHQLCDWEWLEDEDGKILKQVPGKAVFTATLVKYAELMCYRPFGQAKLDGITEA